MEERTQADVFLAECFERNYIVHARGQVFPEGHLLVLGELYPGDMPYELRRPGNGVGRFSLDRERLRSATMDALRIARNLFGPDWAPAIETYDYGALERRVLATLPKDARMAALYGGPKEGDPK